jgi:hypothetical protein
MAKKKKKQTPKDDLIESLMNDVQKISDQTTQHGNSATSDFLLDDEKSGVRSDGSFPINFHGEENQAEEPTSTGEALWQQVKGADPQEAPLDLEQVPDIGEFPEESVIEKDFDRQGLDDKTMDIHNLAEAAGSSESLSKSDQDYDADKTLAVEGFANRQPHPQKNIPPKISFGSLRDPRPKAAGGGSVYASSDANLAQAESLKLAQWKISELEKEVEKYRQENEELASAGEIIRNRYEELNSRFFALEKEKQEISDSFQNELIIVKGTLQHKESETAKARLKIEELETRLKSDFKKIRVRERELENRLELVKAEKTALLRAKDENILELKRKIDHIQSELDNYRSKVSELNKEIGFNQEQFKRTVRALRLALSNLEVKEENLVSLKKAE